MVIPKINSAHGSDTRNIINRAIDLINAQGKSIQDLVAEGQLTPEQYAELVSVVNGNISKGEVSVHDINKNLGRLDGTFFTSQFLADLQNAEINTTNVLPGSITTGDLAGSTVIPEKTNFFKRSTNLLNQNTMSDNKTISASTGELVDSTQNHSTSDFIYVTPNTKYVVKEIILASFYDINKNFISRNDQLPINNVFTTPSGTFYVRMTTFIVRVGVSAQLNVGSTLKPFELFYEYIPKEKVEKEPIELPIDIVKTQHITDGQVTPDKMSIFKRSTNLLNQNTMSDNKTISASTGELVDSTQNHSTSDFINVEPSSTYSHKHFVAIAYYDKDKKFIIRDDRVALSTNFTTPSNARFIRGVTFQIRVGVSAQINVGNTLKPFEVFYNRIPKEYVEQVDEDKTYMLDTDFQTLFSKNKVIDNDYEGRAAAKTSDIHALYETLRAKYPNYIKRTLLGNDSSGTHPIYRYDFKPVRPESPVTVQQPKVLITSGTHPEPAGLWSTYYTLENMCNNWQDDEGLSALRFNIHFIVIPVVNPWGYDAPSRTNSNGVDLARNFPAGWRQGTYIAPPVSNSTYGGPKALSEVEAQYINNIMLDNPDIIAGIDVHNFFGPAGTYRFIWGAVGNKFTRSVTMNHIQRMDRKWKKEYEFVNQNPDVFIGDVDGYAPGGSLGAQADAYGIKGAITYELNIRVGADPSGERIDSNTVTMGYEALTNFILMLTHEILK